ncbi:hypothetical protein D3C81_753190 [compost metagenome]
MRTVRLRFTQRRQCIRRFTGLADHDHERLWRDQRRAITIFRGNVVHHRNAHQLFDRRPADQTGIISRTAGDDMNRGQAADFFVRQFKAWKHNLPSTFVDASQHRVAVSLRLLVDLFQHEMIETAFFRGHGVPIDTNHFPRNKVPFDRHQFDSILRQYRHFTVIQNIHVPRIIQQSRNVGADKVLAFTETDNERASLTNRNQFLGFILGQNPKRKSAAHKTDRFLNGFHDIALIFAGHQMGNHLGVRFRNKDVPLLDQFFLQLQIVFNNPVMHDRKLLSMVGMRMGIHVRRFAVRSPAGMTDPGRSLERCTFQFRLQIGQTSQRFRDFQAI